MYKKLCKTNPWMSFAEWMAFVKELAEVLTVTKPLHEITLLIANLCILVPETN